MNTLIIVIIVLIIVILAIGAVTVWLATKPPTKTVCSNVVYTNGVSCTTTNNVTTCSPILGTDPNTGNNLVSYDTSAKALMPTPASCVNGALANGMCTITSGVSCGDANSGTTVNGTSCKANLGDNVVIDTSSSTNGVVILGTSACGLGTTLTAGACTVNVDTDPTTATAKVDPTSGIVVAASGACRDGTKYNTNFTCTSTAPGATCPTLTAGVKTDGNTVVPDLGSNTVVDKTSHKVVPTNDVCPSGSTLDTTTYTCSAVPTTSCPTAGAGVVLSSDKKSYVANLIDNNVMVDANNKVVIDTVRIAGPNVKNTTYKSTPNDFVVWNDNQCQSTCDCTACDTTTKSAADPKSWVTCSSSECQGSLTMTQKAACDKQIGQTKLSTVPGTLGVDVAGMFDCLAGTSACQYGDLITACKTSSSSPACTSFTVNSNADNETLLAACSGTKPDSTTSAVAFAPFGNNIAPAPKTQSLGRTAAKRKLPGWD